MDPETRRFMWDYIASVRDGRALILTTHSMEEADALCSSIGIMIRGQLRALGSSQELKSAHGEGFQCMIRLSDVSSKRFLPVCSLQRTDRHFSVACLLPSKVFFYVLP